MTGRQWAANSPMVLVVSIERDMMHISRTSVPHVILTFGNAVFATKEVILSSGTFNTPTLLMRSGLGPENTLQAASISPKVHLPGLGQNLNDHTRVQLLSIVDIPSSATYELLPGFDSSLIGWLKLPKVLSSPEYSALPSKNQAIIAGPKTPTCEFLIVSPL